MRQNLNTQFINKKTKRRVKYLGPIPYITDINMESGGLDEEWHRLRQYRVKYDFLISELNNGNELSQEDYEWILNADLKRFVPDTVWCVLLYSYDNKEPFIMTLLEFLNAYEPVTKPVDDVITTLDKIIKDNDETN